MAKKCKKCECPAGEKWAVPFADFLSLLLALFIALYALASVNVEKQAALKEEFLKIYGMNTDSQTLSTPQEDTQVATTTEDPTDGEQGKSAEADSVSAQLNELQQNIENGSFAQITDGAFVSTPIFLQFESGQADVASPTAQAFLKSIAKIVSFLPANTEINLKGFATDKEMINSRYPDSLDLSTARANNVIRELIIVQKVSVQK
ncbi:MAG: OmpA family protein [Arcobacter sp.]|nr:OmpA family protein [Arcobacter sp.]